MNILREKFFEIIKSEGWAIYKGLAKDEYLAQKKVGNLKINLLPTIGMVGEEIEFSLYPGLADIDFIEAYQYISGKKSQKKLLHIF